MLAIAFVAARTKRIRLGRGVTLTPHGFGFSSAEEYRPAMET